MEGRAQDAAARGLDTRSVPDGLPGRCRRGVRTRARASRPAGRVWTAVGRYAQSSPSALTPACTGRRDASNPVRRPTPATGCPAAPPPTPCQPCDMRREALVPTWRRRPVDAASESPAAARPQMTIAAAGSPSHGSGVDVAAGRRPRRPPRPVEGRLGEAPAGPGLLPRRTATYRPGRWRRGRGRRASSKGPARRSPSRLGPPCPTRRTALAGGGGVRTEGEL